MKNLVSILVAPLLCLGLLSGVYAEKSRRVRPEDAEPYHRAARAAIMALPYQIGGWLGRDEEVPQPALKLLKPNAILSRTYVNPSRLGRWVGLLVEQCRDSRDMLGHYPPVCYPAHGMTQTVAREKDWKLPGLTVTGMEYQFTSEEHGEKHLTTVYNFMVIPGVGVVRDMSGVQRAAADYQRRYFGAAQVQMTFPPDLSESERDEIFTTLIGPNVPMLKTLIAGGLE